MANIVHLTSRQLRRPKELQRLRDYLPMEDQRQNVCSKRDALLALKADVERHGTRAVLCVLNTVGLMLWLSSHERILFMTSPTDFPGCSRRTLTGELRGISCLPFAMERERKDLPANIMPRLRHQLAILPFFWYLTN